MKFKVETSEFQNAIKVLGMVARPTATDVTNRVLITTEDNQVVMFANNGSTAISVTLQKVLIEEIGSCAVSYSKIKPFVTSFMPWDGASGLKEFVVSIDDNNLKLNTESISTTGKKAKAKLVIETYIDGLASIFRPFGEPTFCLSALMIKTAVNKVSYAIDQLDTRPAIQGMHLSFDDKNIYFVGTNGFVLSQYQVDNISEFKKGSITLKYDFIITLRRILKDDLDVYFEIDKSSIKAKFDNVVLWGKTISSEYPEYNSKFNSFKHLVNVDREIFMNSLSSILGALNPEDNNRVSFQIKDSKINLHCDHADILYDDDIDYSEEFIIDVNGDFLFKTVDAIKDDKVLIKFSDSKNILVFDSSNFENQKALLTPIRRR